jgi:RNA recognition motif-containing protein
MNNIFVGNLSFETTKEDVIKLFEPFGTVASAVIMERKKGKSRGYGFVDMPNEDEKNAAITALQGKEFMWRVLSVSPVIPKVKGEESKKFKPVKKEWNRSEGQEAKPWSKPKSDFKPRRDDRSPRSESASDAKSKYYSKFDGPPKPWRKMSKDSKPSRKKDEGTRPYYGKKEENSKFYNPDGQPSKPDRRDDKASRPGSSKPPYKKFDSQSKPWDNKAKAFKKPGTGFKMSHKVSGAPKSR